MKGISKAKGFQFEIKKELELTKFKKVELNIRAGLFKA